MNDFGSEVFRESVSRLHRQKDAAYRNAWKKRGEVLSIVANVARKVDRLEYAMDGAPSVGDESIIDTTVDLFVYLLKYQTYLADLDADVAANHFGEASRVNTPYSEGVQGFDFLLAATDLAVLDQPVGPTVVDAAAAVVVAFSSLEKCFGESTAPVDRRAALIDSLVHATVLTIGALAREQPGAYERSMTAYLKGSN